MINHFNNCEVTIKSDMPIRAGELVIDDITLEPIGIAIRNSDNDGYVPILLNGSFNVTFDNSAIDMNNNKDKICYQTIIESLAKARKDMNFTNWIYRAGKLLNYNYNYDVYSIPTDVGVHIALDNDSIARSIKLWELSKNKREFLHPQLQYLLKITDSINNSRKLHFVSEYINADKFIVDKIGEILGKSDLGITRDSATDYEEYEQEQQKIYNYYGETYINVMNNLQLYSIYTYSSKSHLNSFSRSITLLPNIKVAHKYKTKN